MALLPCVAEACQREVESARAEPLQEAADRLRTSDRHDRDALGAEIPAPALGQRLERVPVADPLDEHDGAGCALQLASGSLILHSTCRTIASVAYDEELADRIREVLGGEPGLSEQKMFGGLAFLVGGNMAVAASGQGGILVRVDPAESDTLVVTTSAHLMEMRGRQMQGWLRVDADDVRTQPQLAEWVERGLTYARSLPAKR